MRDEEKLLRIKINELEKKKNQYSQEIEMKQRTIQQLKVVFMLLMVLEVHSAGRFYCLIKCVSLFIFYSTNILSCFVALR